INACSNQSSVHGVSGYGPFSCTAAYPAAAISGVMMIFSKDLSPIMVVSQPFKRGQFGQEVINCRLLAFGFLHFCQFGQSISPDMIPPDYECLCLSRPFRHSRIDVTGERVAVVVLLLLSFTIDE